MKASLKYYQICDEDDNDNPLMGVVILRLVQFRNAWGSSTVRPCTTSNTCSTLIIPRYQPLVHLGHRHHHHNFHWYDKFVNEKPKIEFQEITPSQHQKRVGAHKYQRARDTGWYGTWWNWVSIWQYWLVLGGTGIFIISIGLLCLYLYIEKSGALVRCYRSLTYWQIDNRI